MDTAGTRTTAPPPVTRLETRSIDYVPVAERHGKVWHLGPLWFSGNAQLATLVIGAAGVASGLSFSWSLVAIFLGAVIGTLFMAFHSAQGPKLGLPQMIQSRPQFGYYGALLPVIVAVLLFIGFNVFNTQTVLTYDSYSELRFGVPNPDFGQAGVSGVISGQQFATPRQIRIGVRYEF